MSFLTTLDERPVTRLFNSVGSTDTTASGLNNLQGLGAVVLPRRWGQGWDGGRGGGSESE